MQPMAVSISDTKRIVFVLKDNGDVDLNVQIRKPYYSYLNWPHLETDDNPEIWVSEKYFVILENEIVSFIEMAKKMEKLLSLK